MAARRRALVLVDGEHQPAAVRSALDELHAAGDDPAHVLYVGGSEKVEAAGDVPDLGYPASWPRSAERDLLHRLRRDRFDVVIDRTADPVVDDLRRGRLIAIALSAGVAFESPGAAFRAPPRARRLPHPAVAVIATAKRTGKTAVSGALARHARDAGRRPCVVAMGRGGPAEPVVIPAGRDLGPAELIEVARRGEHAASDFYEDAVMTGVPTIGCRRVGEGPTGEVGSSNVDRGLDEVERLDVDLVVLEGSGAAIPPAHADATLLVVPATVPPVALHAALPLRFLLADLVVLTMADPRLVDREQVRTVVDTIATITRALSDGDGAGPAGGVVVTRFRPTPLAPVAGRRVFVATTAPGHVGRSLAADLEEQGAEVVGITHALADRPRLREQLGAAPAHDLLLTELKAAGVDVAAASAAERGVEVAFYDNRPVAVPELADGRELGAALDALLARADGRFADRQEGP